MASGNPYTLKVFDKLAELKQWQCEQHERLIREQEEQRRVLAEEQQKRMENLGIENIGDLMADRTLTPHEEDDLHGVSILSSDSEEWSPETQQLNDSPDVTQPDGSSYEDTTERISDSENETAPKMVFIEQEDPDTNTEKRKFTFLKRGEGLSRFKMTPHDILAQKQRIQASRGKPGKKKTQTSVKLNKNKREKQPSRSVEVEVKSQATKAKQSTGVANDGKMIVPRSPSLPTLHLDASKSVRPSYGQDINFPVKTTNSARIQAPSGPSRPFSAPQGQMPPSGPSKTLIPTQIQSSSGPNVPLRTVNVQGSYSGPYIPPRTVNPTHVQQTLEYPSSAQAMMSMAPQWTNGECQPPSWAAMLTQNQLKSALSASADTSRKLEQKELRMFEKLERIAADSSFCSSSSVVTKFVEGGYISSSVQSTPQVTPIKQPPEATPVQPPPRGELELPDTSTPFSNPAIDNARALLEKLAAFKFGEQTMEQLFNADVSDEIMLDLRPLQLTEQPHFVEEQPEQHEQHVRFKETPQVREVEVDREAWSDSEEDSSLETDTETESEVTPQADSSSEEANDKKEEERLAIGSMVHTRLEQLQQELINVQTQQTALSAQRAELANERQRLADVVAQTEEERRKLAGERKNLAVITKKRQGQDRQEIEELKKQLSELQIAWRDREARWAAAQASQRAQLRQISLENKEMALQINQLKTVQNKKVQFASATRTQPARARRQVEMQTQTSDKAPSRRQTVTGYQVKTTNPEPVHHTRSNSASPSLPLHSQVSYQTSGQYRPENREVTGEFRPKAAQVPSEYASANHQSSGQYRPQSDVISGDYRFPQNTAAHPSYFDVNTRNQNRDSNHEDLITRAQNIVTNSTDFGMRTQNAVTKPQNVDSNPRTQNQASNFEGLIDRAQNIETNPPDFGFRTQNSAANPQNFDFNTRTQNQASNHGNLIVRAQNTVANTPNFGFPTQNAAINPQNLDLNPRTQNQASNRNNLIARAQNTVANPSDFGIRTQNATINSPDFGFPTQNAATNPQNFDLNTRTQNQASYDNLIAREQNTVADFGFPTQNVASNSQDFDTSIKTLSEEDLKLTSTNDIDAVIAKYKDLCNIGPSPSCSLVLNTPRSINQAYQAIFNDNKSHVINMREDSSIHQSTDCGVQNSGYVVENSRIVTQSNCGEYIDYSIQSSRYVLQTGECNGVSVENSRVLVQNSGENQVQNSELEFQRSEVNSSFINIRRFEERSQCDGEACRNVLYDDGSRQLWFPSGNTMKVSPDGCTRTVIFYNGDIQETLGHEGVVRYFYAANRAWHETFNDGTEIITFPDGQTEKKLPSGRREVRFADDSLLSEYEDGRQETIAASGARLMVETDGTSVLTLPNGLREVRTKEHTRLEYPDGTTRTKYPSGLLETRYCNGRVRVKDSSGKLIMDTHCPVPQD